jgi:hypothetical protein
VSSLLFLLAVLVQAGLAGLFVTGDVDMHAGHPRDAGLVAATLVVWISGAVLLWRPVRGPAWPIAAGAAALAVVFGQLALGYSGVVALHIPLGVAIFGLAVRLTIWAFSYRPGKEAP